MFASLRFALALFAASVTSVLLSGSSAQAQNATPPVLSLLTPAFPGPPGYTYTLQCSRVVAYSKACNYLNGFAEFYVVTNPLVSAGHCGFTSTQLQGQIPAAGNYAAAPIQPISFPMKNNPVTYNSELSWREVIQPPQGGPPVFGSYTTTQRSNNLVVVAP